MALGFELDNLNFANQKCWLLKIQFLEEEIKLRKGNWDPKPYSKMYHIIELQDSNQLVMITKSTVLIPHDMDARIIPGLCVITLLVTTHHH